MGTLDALLRGQAASVIQQYGIDVVYTRVTTEGFFDSENMEKVSDVTTETTVRVVAVQTAAMSSASTLRTRTLDHVDTVSIGDYVLYIAASEISFEPVIKDSFVVAGKTYAVTQVVEHRSGDQLALFEVYGKTGTG